MNHETLALRAAIGIQGTGFELSQDDYFELYQFDVPDNWEAFQQSCDQVKAKYPTLTEFQALQRRHLRELDNPPKPSPSAAAERAQAIADFYANTPGLRQRGSK